MEVAKVAFYSDAEHTVFQRSKRFTHKIVASSSLPHHDVSALAVDEVWMRGHPEDCAG